MLNIIIGENAVGKTVMLRKMASQINRLDIASNLSKYQNFIGMTLKYNMGTIDFISKELGDPVVLENEEQLFIEGYGRDFLDIMTVLSRNVANFYLDEPEYGLREYEVNMMAHVLVKLAYELPSIWITTQTELLLDINSSAVSYYTVERNNLGEFVLKNIEWQDVCKYVDTF